MKKKVVIGVLLSLTVFLSISFNTAFADEPISVNVDGQTLQTDTPPEIVNGSTLVPMSAIMEALGLDVSWDPKTKTVTAKNDQYTVVLPIGSKTATVNGKQVQLTVPAMIKKGHTMIPAAFVSKSVGADVKWNAKTKTVNITTSDFSRNFNNTTNVGDINNSSVTITNNNTDNSINTNTTNNYTTNNYITNNYNVTMDEDLLKKILSSLSGTKYLDSEGTVTPTDDSVKLEETPVILSLTKQPSAIWKDGILEYKEIVGKDCTLAFLLPKGLDTGSSDKKTGINHGYVKYVEIFDENEDSLGKFPSPIGKLELQKGVAIIPLDTNLFSKVKDGQTYQLKVFIEKDGQTFASYSEPVSFQYKDNQDVHIKMSAVHIISISDSVYSDKDLFNSFGDFDFLITVESPKNTRAQSLAWRECTDAATKDFVLKADGKQDIQVECSGYSMFARNSTLYAMKIIEPEKIVKGVNYTLVPVEQNPQHQWVVNDGLFYTAK